MTLRERIQKLCKINGTSLNQVETELNFGKGYLSKLDNSTPNTKKMEQVANRFGVTIDFLMGKVDKIQCPECKQIYNPFNEIESSIHDNYHSKRIKALKKYPFIIEDYFTANMEECFEYENFKNSSRSFEDRINSYNKYLVAKFSNIAGFSNDEEVDYSEFCKAEVRNLEYDSSISHEIIYALDDQYGVDKNLSSRNKKLLEKASKNQQLMRILEYAEKLNSGMLNTIEIQLKALAEQQKKQDDVINMNDYVYNKNVNAAHSRTDINVPEGTDTSDNDIMDDDNF